jgi:hypothetical protein
MVVTLHSPSSIAQSEHLSESFELPLSKWLRKDISDIVVCRNVLHVNGAILNGLANKMITYVDVFRARVEFIVLHKRDSTLIVAIKSGRFLEW